MIEPTRHGTAESRVGFHWALVAFALLVFGGNWSHSNQQQIFITRYISVAEAVLHGVLPYSVTHVFYPMWGYPVTVALGLALGHPTFVIEMLQLVSALLSLVAAYWLLDLQKRLRDIPLFLPYFALCSVKWPDAFVAILFLLHVALSAKFIQSTASTRGRWIYLTAAGFVLALIVNFRTEYFLFPLAEIGVAGAYFVRRRSKPLLMVAAASALACALGILPWYLYTAGSASHARLTTSNGAGVAYISLGQLPGNPWGIRHLDSDAFKKANQRGIADPYSEAGEHALTEAVDSAVAAHPAAFAMKVGRNLGMALVGGLYTGEYANLLLTDPQRTQLEQAHSVKGIPFSSVAIFAAEKALRILSMPLLLLLMLLFVRLKRPGHGAGDGVYPILLSLILYRLATVALIQYEPRHLNLIYAPLVFYVLILFQSRPLVAGKRGYSLKSFLR